MQSNATIGSRTTTFQTEWFEQYIMKMYETFTATAQEIEAYDAEWQKNAMTQLDLNTFSQTSYIKWDTLLNDIYQYLEKSLPADEFEVLESEQIQWIKEKE